MSYWAGLFESRCRWVGQPGMIQNDHETLKKDHTRLTKDEALVKNMLGLLFSLWKNEKWGKTIYKSLLYVLLLTVE